MNTHGGTKKQRTRNWIKSSKLRSHVSDGRKAVDNWGKKGENRLMMCGTFLVIRGRDSANKGGGSEKKDMTPMRRKTID